MGDRCRCAFRYLALARSSEFVKCDVTGNGDNEAQNVMFVLKSKCKVCVVEIRYRDMYVLGASICLSRSAISFIYFSMKIRI